jgi:hypothetical protein
MRAISPVGGPASGPGPPKGGAKLIQYTYVSSVDSERGFWPTTSVFGSAAVFSTRWIVSPLPRTVRVSLQGE